MGQLENTFDNLHVLWHKEGTINYTRFSVPDSDGFFMPILGRHDNGLRREEKAEYNTLRGNKLRRRVAVVGSRLHYNRILNYTEVFVMSQELIPTAIQVISGQETQTVNARELHAFLESKQQYADWIKGRIADYNFSENEDFVFFHNSMKKPERGRPAKEYFITLDMAKELSMVERTEKGRQARRYFIECERRLRNLTTFKALPPPTLTPEQQRKVQTLIAEKVYSTGNKALNPVYFKQVYRLIKDKFQVAKYDQVPAIRFDELIEFIGKTNIIDNQMSHESRMLHVWDMSEMNNSVRNHIDKIQDELSEIRTAMSRIAQDCCLLIPEYGEMKTQKRMKELLRELAKDQSSRDEMSRALAKA